MIRLNHVKTSTLFFLGTATLALGTLVRVLKERPGHSNGATDFTFGLFFGIGFGILMIVAWRSGRKQRNHPD